LNLAKKALSAATSAALVASLLATAVVPVALADQSVGGSVSVPVGGTSSGTALALTFNDASTKTGTISTTGTTTGFCAVTLDGTRTGTLTYTLTDAAGGHTLSFTGTPTFAPGLPSSLGASVALSQKFVANDSFTVSITGCDPNNVEQFTVTGLQIAATSSAATGTINGTLTDNGTGFIAAVTGSTTTATGTLQAIILPNYDLSVNTTSTCGFAVTGGLNGTATFGAQTGLTITGVSGTVPGLQTIILPSGAGLTGAHTVGETVTQTVAACGAISSPGTVGSVATQNAALQAATQQQVNPGQQNQPAGTTTLTEPSAGFLAAASTITYKISAPGVLFSHAPTATVSGTGIAVPAPTLSYTVAYPTPAVTGGLNAAGTYWFEVTARGATSGETAPSLPVGVTCLVACSITLNWTAVTGAFGYNVYYSATVNGTYLAFASPVNPVGGTSVVLNGATLSATPAPSTNNALPVIAAPTGLTASHVDNAVAGTAPGAVANGTYYFVATATNASGETTASNVATVVVSATVPGTAAVTLSWPAVTGATGYRLYQGASAAGPFIGTHGAVVSPDVITTTPVASGTFLPPTVSTAGTTTSTGGGMVLSSSLCALSLDRTSCTVTISTASTTASTITLSNIYLDVASTVPYGTAVNLVVTTSPVVTLSVTANTIAYVAQALLAVSVQAVPTVYMDYNAQPSGVITVSESMPGFFQAGSSGNNTLTLCTDGYETFTFAPYAIVTAGNVSLLNTSTYVGTTSAQSTLNSTATCATWYVFSASTTASTISIVGANASGALSATVATDGPTLSVMANAPVGPVLMTVTSGTSTTTLYSKQVSNAVRAFKSNVTVTAVSQPYLRPGTTNAAGGVTIAETLNGQLLAGELITCTVLPNPQNDAQQTYLATANANNLPVVTTGGGMLAHLVGTTNTSFTVAVDQQAFAPSFGSINVGNLWFTTISGATTGPVTLECMNGTQYTGSTLVTGTIAAYSVTGSTAETCFDITGSGFVPGAATIDAGTINQESVTLFAHSGTACTAVAGHQYFDVLLTKTHTSGAPIQETVGGGTAFMTGTAFDQFVSNAIVGVPSKLNIAANSALGLNPTRGYTMITPKYQAVRKYVTWKFTGGMALAGQRVNILVAKHINGAWGGPVYYKSAWADANGIVTFAWTSKTAGAINVRVQWPGNLSYAVSVSKALGAYYK
jgi:hypothetical protein